MTRRGFTLLEMLTSLTLMAILLGMIVPRGAAMLRRARQAQAQGVIWAVQDALAAYRIEAGTLPPPESLAALARAPVRLPDGRVRDEPLLDLSGTGAAWDGDRLIDAQGNPVLYYRVSGEAGEGYVLHAPGDPSDLSDDLVVQEIGS